MMLSDGGTPAHTCQALSTHRRGLGGGEPKGAGKGAENF